MDLALSRFSIFAFTLALLGPIGGSAENVNAKGSKPSAVQVAKLDQKSLREVLQKAVNFLAEDQIKTTMVKHIGASEFLDLVNKLPSEAPFQGEASAKRKARSTYKAELIESKIEVSSADSFLAQNGKAEASAKALTRKDFEESWPWRRKASESDGQNVGGLDLSNWLREFSNPSSSRIFLGYERIQGEWPCYMKAEKSIPLLGKKGTEAYDSNNFTPIAVHNNLASVYLDNPQLKNVLPMLDSALETSLRHYYSNGAFNFWPRQPKLMSILPKVEEKFLFELVSRPNNFPLKGNYVNKRADVANDADDTAMAYQMLELNQRAKKVFSSNSGVTAVNSEPKNSELSGSPNLPKGIELKSETPILAEVFSPFRDQNRKKSYPYNVLHGNYQDTGAFLTWLMDEHHGFWSVLWDLEWDTTGIHGGLNDLDCVVNANVLSALATYGQLDIPGVEDSCRFLNEVAEGRGKDMKTCGIYYPNPYQFHYSVAKAFHTGASCLKPASDSIRRKLVQEQLGDGSWPEGITKEPIQSTLYALNALLAVDDLSDREFVAATKGLEYLLGHSELKEDKMSWPAGVFFGGGFLIRKNLIWRSQAYSTSLGLTAVNHYLRAMKARGMP